jgi:mono/diheme cytochrome c family protein
VDPPLIADPQKVKPGSYMPDVIGDTPRDRDDADAITHFLVSLGGPVEWEPIAREPQVIDEGRRLYHSVGCVACHGAFEPAAKVFGEATLSTGMPATSPPSPFGALAGKWRPAALSEYLQDPLRTHPSGRMPSVNLSAAEADLLATYLLSAWGQSDSAGKSGFRIDPARVDAGKAAFMARGCANCHEIGHGRPNLPGGLKAQRLAALKPGKGCLGDDPAAPRFTLDEQAKADLASGLAAIAKVVAAAGSARAPIDEGRRTFAALGCAHCHERDGAGGVPDDLKLYFRTTDETELGDEGRIPPHLDGVGFKLHASWLRAVLVDHARVRPYMAARMPQFGEKRVGEPRTRC